MDRVLAVHLISQYMISGSILVRSRYVVVLLTVVSFILFLMPLTDIFPGFPRRPRLRRLRPRRPRLLALGRAGAYKGLSNGLTLFFILLV